MIPIFRSTGKWNAALIVCVLIVLAFGLMERIHSNEVVIPDHFVGPVVVIPSAHGSEPERINGGFRLTVPQSGVLYLADTPMFGRAHWTVRTTSGRVVPVDYGASQYEIAFRFGGSRSGEGPNRYEFFVGTEKDYHEFDFSSFTRPLAAHPK